MNISDRSWHYRLVSTFAGPAGIPSNLCPYIRRLLLSMLFAVLMTAAAALIAFTLLRSFGITLVFLIDRYIYDFSWFTMSDKYTTEVATAVTITSIVTVAAVWLRFDAWRAHRRWAREYYGEQTPPREPSVFGQWLKDRHDQVCRPITVIRSTPDDSEDELSDAAKEDAFDAQVDAVIDDILAEDQKQDSNPT